MSTHFKGPVISENGFSGTITGNITGNVTGNVSGNQSGGSVAATTSTSSTSTTVGTGGTPLTLIKKGTVAVTVTALTAGDEEEYDLVIAGAAVGDTVIMNPPAAAAETGLAQILCWVISSGHIGLRVSNVNTAAALAGSTSNWSYCLIRS